MESWDSLAGERGNRTEGDHAAEVDEDQRRCEGTVDEGAVDNEVYLVEAITQDRNPYGYGRSRCPPCEPDPRPLPPHSVHPTRRSDDAVPTSATMAEVNHFICWRSTPRDRRKRTTTDATAPANPTKRSPLSTPKTGSFSTMPRPSIPIGLSILAGVHGRVPGALRALRRSWARSPRIWQPGASGGRASARRGRAWAGR